MRKGDVNVQRFKGLGEMEANQLWESTMDPLTRKLYKVNYEDEVGIDKLFTILMGSEVEPRRQFIEEHALEVVDLVLETDRLQVLGLGLHRLPFVFRLALRRDLLGRGLVGRRRLPRRLPSREGDARGNASPGRRRYGDATPPLPVEA